MRKSIFALFAVGLLMIFSGCSKNKSEGPGRLVMTITDDPFPFSSIESATVTITKIELRKAGDCNCDSVPFQVVFNGSETVDLLGLRNGLIQKLIDIEIPQGQYDLARIYVDEAGLQTKDGGSYSVKVPSGKQTGIKVFIKPGLVVEGGLTSEVLLDFDLSKSFVLRGNPDKAAVNGFIFKPVIRAVNNTTAGRLEGMVRDTAGVKIKEAAVWVKQDTIVATTVGDTLGHFAIIGLPSGTYSVFAAKDNYDTVEVDNVKIYVGNRTELNFVLPPR